MTGQIVRYGKSVAEFLQHKQNFYSENDRLVDRQIQLAQLYRQQSVQTRCRMCDVPLNGPAILSLNVPYISCNHCSHLNGAHEDTITFCRALYTEDAAGYGQEYQATDHHSYQRRVRDLYLPKASFLLDGLRATGLDPTTLTFADFGCGSGYFLTALRDASIASAVGYEVSKAQIELARYLNPDIKICQHDIEEVETLAATVNADVFSFIGVLEHLQNMRGVLRALRANRSAKFLFFAVPMLSLAVYIEQAFPKVMKRQLSGGHIHLFTEASIDYMCQEFGFRRVAEWWFGADVVDLVRSIMVSLGPGRAASEFERLMLPLMDDWQLAIDRHKWSSEVHMLVTIERT
jgi:SAM-dependent methyltransferase